MKRKKYVSPRIDFISVGNTVHNLTEQSGSGEGSAVLVSWLLG